MADKNVNIKIGSTADPAGVNKAMGWFGKIKSGVSLIAATSLFPYFQRAIGYVTEFGRSSVEAYSKQEEAESRLSATLRNSNENVKQYMTTFRALASSLQQVTTFGDENILMEMSRAHAMGVSTDKLAEYTRASVGLAERLQKDLPTAFDLISKASAGNFTMLQKYAVSLKLTGNDAEKFAQVLKYGTEGLKIAQERVDSLTFSNQQLANSYSDLKEAMGKSLLLASGTTPESIQNRKKMIDIMASNKLFVDKVKDIAPIMKENIEKAPGSLINMYTRAYGAISKPIDLSASIIPTAPAYEYAKNQNQLNQWIAEAKAQENLGKIANNTAALPVVASPK